MNTAELKQTLVQLKDKVHRLAEEELDDVGDPARRYSLARSLNDQLTGLRSHVDGAPAGQKAELDDLWRAAQRDLIFLLSAAAQAEKPAAQDVRTQAQQVSTAAFELAKAFVDGRTDRAELQQRARELDNRLKQLAHLPGHAAADVQQALGEADLELSFVLAGGRGPTSIRLFQYQRDVGRPG